MKPISSTDMPSLKFNIKEGTTSQKYRMPNNRIGWIHTLSDKPGAKFDIVIKDVFGRKVLEKKNCGNATNQYGELINHSTDYGQDLEVVIENVKGADSIDVFLN